MALAGRHQDRERAALAVAGEVDFGGQSASGSTEGVIVRFVLLVPPPFRPARRRRQGRPLLRRCLLFESLAVLAADAPCQVAWLYKQGVVTDEIALDFDHAFDMAEALVGEGQLSRGVLTHLREIEAVLDEMSGAENADRWTRDALSVDEGWRRARGLARRVLVAELREWQLPLPEITVIR